MASQAHTVSVVSETLLANVATTALLLSLVPVLLFGLNCYYWYRKPANLPVLNLKGWGFEKAKTQYISNLFSYLKLGRETFHNQPFLLWGTEGYITIIPEVLIDELKNADDSVLDNSSFFKNVTSDHHWFDWSHTAVLRRVVIGHLTPRLSILMPQVIEEADYAVQTELPESEEWTSVVVYKSLLRIVALISGRVFVGPTLNRSEEWMSMCINFTLDVFNAGRALRSRSYLGKSLAVKFGIVPEVKRVYDHQKAAQHILLPMIQERQALQAKGADVPNDMMSWIIEEKSSDGRPLPASTQAELQLHASLAAIHTTTLTATNFLYDLAARPEYLAPLREEIDEVWESEGLTKTSLAKLVKLDSFLKESQRLNPASQLTFDREVRAKGGITLSNGVHLRQGARIAIAANQMSLDSDIWENPDEFQGFRFAKLRSAKKQDANRFQFATTSAKNSLYFGNGRHECPGRFFASNEIKTIVAFLIRKYDIKAAPDSETRPPSIRFGSRMGPNPNISVMMKKREGNYRDGNAVEENPYRLSLKTELSGYRRMWLR